MTTRLRKLKIDRIDLVDQGANPHSHVMLFKRRDPVTADSEEVPMSESVLDPTVEKRITDIEKANTELVAKVAAAEAAKTASDAALAKAVAAQETTSAELKAIREAGEQTAAETLAKSLGIPDKADLLLVSKRSLPPETYEALVATLTAQKTAVDTALVVTKGHSHDTIAAGSAMAEIKKRAKDLVDAGKATNIDAAVADVVTSDAALYERALAER